MAFRPPAVLRFPRRSRKKAFACILWIKNNELQNWEKIKLFLAPNQYVVYKFTGEIVMDYTSVGNLGGIYDLKTMRGLVRVNRDDAEIDFVVVFGVQPMLQ